MGGRGEEGGVGGGGGGEVRYYLIPIPLNSIHCNFASVDSRIVLLEQNPFGEFTSAFFMDPSSQLVGQICIIRTCYCTFLCWKVQHNNALCVPKYSCHHLASRGLLFEPLWPWRPQPYPLVILSFILWLIIMDPGLIYGHQT